MISIVIPTYMEEKYIEKTLKSIKAQNFKNYEIIVSDGGSTDNTVKIAKKYTKNVIVSKKRGISLGRNLGAKRAKGDILLFLDADTILEENFLKEMNKVFRNKKIALAAGYIKTYGKKRYKIAYQATSEAVGILSKTTPGVYGISFCVRKNVFKKVRGFNENLETAEDIDFAKRASKYGKCVLVRKAIAITSPRRLVGMGFTKAIIFHIKNFFRYTIFKRGAKEYSVERKG